MVPWPTLPLFPPLLTPLLHLPLTRDVQVGLIEVEIPVNLIEPVAQTGPVPEEDEDASNDGPVHEGKQAERSQADAVQMRVIFSNPSGHKVQVNAYAEVLAKHGEVFSGYRFKSIMEVRVCVCMCMCLVHECV